MVKFSNLLLLTIFTIATQNLLAKDLIPVNIGLLEAFATSDSEASNLTYRRHFEASFYYAFGENNKRLNECGYHFTFVPQYFDNIDLITAKEQAAILDELNAWIIFGPRRSNYFLVAAEGLSKTPMVSSMATTQKIKELDNLFFTMAPTTIDLANAAISLAKDKNFGQRYGTLIDVTCPSCKEFAYYFDKTSADQFKLIFSQQSSGTDNEAEINYLIETIRENDIDFLLLPNMSRFSSYVISSLQDEFPGLKFLGGDGWGDVNYTYINAYPINSGTIGVSVRPGLSHDEMKETYNIYSMSSYWNNEFVEPNYAMLSVVLFVRKVTDLICSIRPSDKASFVDQVLQLDKNYFSASMGISAYEFVNGKQSYLGLYE